MKLGLTVGKSLHWHKNVATALAQKLCKPFIATKTVKLVHLHTFQTLHQIMV